MKQLLVICIFLIFVILPLEARGYRLQILHTNDMHSFFEGSRKNGAGYARLKTKVNLLKENAQKKGMETLFLDGGDFGEGSSFFMADHGATSLRLLDELGVDVTVLGNHDFMLGGKVLYDQIQRANLKAKVLSANLNPEKWPHIKNAVHESVIIEKRGVKIGIFGLTTADDHYQHFIRDTGKILHPLEEVRKIEKGLVKKNADIIIALTHIGFNLDKKIAKKSKNIDFIIGGHSHIEIPEPHYEVNKVDKKVPIFQAGEYTGAIGEIILDINEKTKKATLVSYKLHKVTPKLSPETRIQKIINAARVSRNQVLGRDYDEIIGSTTFEIPGYANRASGSASCWSKDIAKLTREVTNADLSVHSEVFEGESIPAGPIRWGDIVENYPHFKTFGDKGWEIATVRVAGIFLEGMLRWLDDDEEELKFYISGLKVKKTENSKEFLIDDYPLRYFYFYTVAVPNDIIEVLRIRHPWLEGLLYRSYTKTGIHYWDMIENYVRKNSPLTCNRNYLAETSDLLKNMGFAHPWALETTCDEFVSCTNSVSVP